MQNNEVLVQNTNVIALGGGAGRSYQVRV